MILRTLGRLVVVPVGFLLGTVTAAFVLLSLGLERVTQSVHGRNVDLADWSQIVELLRGFHSLATVAAIAPALLLVIVGEVARIRSSTYYIIGGGAALAALPLLARSGSLGSGLSVISLIWQVFATAGFAGGFVYWLVAGRRA